MRKLKLFTIEGFDITDPEWDRRSPASFKLDLRNACKQSNLYWKKIDSPYVKNLGQLIFGVPDNWKGLFEMRYKEHDTTTSADIEVFLDRRIHMFQNLLLEMRTLLEEGLDRLKEAGIIRDYRGE